MSEERLIVALEARIKDFEKKFDRAEKKATGNYSKMRRSSKTATAQMERDMIRSTSRMNRALASTSTQVGAFSKSMKRNIATALTVGGITAATKTLMSVSRGMADISREAKRAGVDVKSFQELKYVSEKNRIDVDAMVDGLKELNIRADEFIVTGKGGGAEAFERLGYTAGELATKLEKPSDLLVEIIERTGKLEKAAQIRIFDEIFGGSAGERYVELIDQGAEGIRDTIQEANRLGAVFDEDVLTKADEVDKRFHELSTTVESKLKRAIVNAADELQNFIDRFNEAELRQEKTIKSDIGSIREDRSNIDAKIRELQNQREKLNSAVLGTPKFGRNLVVDNIDNKINQLKHEKESLMQQALKLQDILDRRNGLGSEPDLSPQKAFVYEPPSRGRIKPRKRKASGGGKGGTSRSSMVSQIERERKAVKDLISELEYEQSMIGQSDRVRERSEALRKAGSTATEAQRAKIAMLTDAIYDEREAERLRGLQVEETQRQTEVAVEQRREMFKGLIDDTRDALADGKLDWDDFANIAIGALDRIINSYKNGLGNMSFAGGDPFAADAAALGGGGGGMGGILSSIMGMFGGARASGGGMMPGHFYRVNENGPEYAMNAASTAKYRPHLEAMNNGNWTPPVMAQPVPVPLASNNNQSIKVVIGGNIKVTMDDDKFKGEVVELSAQVVRASTPSIVEQSTQSSINAFGKGGFDTAASGRFGQTPKANIR